MFLTGAATEIAVKFARLPPALLQRISMQFRLLRRTRPPLLAPCEKAERLDEISFPEQRPSHCAQCVSSIKKAKATSEFLALQKRIFQQNGKR